MNNMSETALLGEVNKLKSAHNNLANKAGGDLNQMATAIRQVVAAVTDLQNRMAAIEGVLRGAASRAQQPVRMMQTQPQAPIQTQTAPVPQTQVIPAASPVEKPALNLNAKGPLTTTPDPMSAGWSDDEEDADYEDA